MKRKLRTLFVILTILFAALAGRLLSINRTNGEEYKKQVLSQQAYDSREIPFKRGTITDAKGTVLATSELVYNVILDSWQVNSGTKSDGTNPYLEPTLQAAAELGLDRETIAGYIKDHPDSRYYIAKKNLSYVDKTAYEDKLAAPAKKVGNIREQLKAEQEKPKAEQDEAKITQIQAQLDAANREKENMDLVTGIWFEPAYIRSYPNGTELSNVLGFANNSNVGMTGLEEYYNSTLNGTPGREYGYLNGESNLERTTIEATDGNNLVLTIDFNIQSIIEKYLKKFNDEQADKVREGYGANNVGCIIQDIHNGDILGMASYPNYDLSDPYDLSRIVGMPVLDDKDNPTDEYMTQEDVDALTTNEQKSRYLNALWRNFCISTYYEPGSVAKPFTLAAGLESGKMTGDETYYCGGSLEVGGWEIKCHNTDGDGVLTVDQAIERSCNVALMQMAQQIGVEDFAKFQRIFSFGLKTNIDLAGEARTDSMIIPADKMSVSDLATNSFGQNFDVTMIEMITAFSSLINGGNYYQPHVVSKITSPSGATIRNIQPRLVKKTVSESTSAKIREATLAVVAGANGTGHSARPAGYMIGGKTGTAETYPRGNGEYVVSFMGYAPADDPQIAIYVVIDRINDSPQDQTGKATALTREILTEVLPYLNIYMTEPLTEAEEEELQKLNLANTYAYNADNIGEAPVELIKNLDSDGDGVMDSVDGDGDGSADLEMDADADGVMDCVDTNGDGIPDLFDTDNDGVVDSKEPPEDAVDPTILPKTWTQYERDPVTGYFINPTTGLLIDPETGYTYSDSTMGEDNAGATVIEDNAGATTPDTALEEAGTAGAGTAVNTEAVPADAGGGNDSGAAAAEAAANDAAAGEAAADETAEGGQAAEPAGSQTVQDKETQTQQPGSGPVEAQPVTAWDGTAAQ